MEYKGVDKGTLAEIQKRIQREMTERESRLLEYWKGELQKIYGKRPESLAALQLELKGFLERMENRIRMLRKQ